jgi:hypothetical protein
MHTSPSIFLSTSQNPNATPPNHYSDLSSTPLSLLSKSTVAAPSHPCLIVIGRRGRWVVPNFCVTLNYWGSSPTFSSWTSKAPCWTLSHSPPPLSPNRSPPLDPTCPQTDLHPSSSVIKLQTTPAPLDWLIQLPSHHSLTLPSRTRALDPCARGEARKLLSICKLARRFATDLNSP